MKNELFHIIFFSPSVSHGVVRRQCGLDGLWKRDESGHVWRDLTQCEEEKEVTSQEVEHSESDVSKSGF